jgi:hypothetical protein
MAKDNEVHELLDLLFRQAQMQFGSAIKSRWFYDGDDCPGCRKPISAMKYKQQQALSLNSFMYRDHGVVIGYLLCGKCAHFIFRDAEKNPGSMKETPLHDKIEKTLKAAYVRLLGH